VSYNSSGVSNCSSNNSSNGDDTVTKTPSHDIAKAKMTNIKHKIDIGLKVTTQNCGEHTYPLLDVPTKPDRESQVGHTSPEAWKTATPDMWYT